MGYSYYDTPEGDDCFKKMWFMTKYGAMAGTLLSIYDIMLYSHPQGFAKTVQRFGYMALPVTGMATAFAATTCAAASIRKKEDYLNPVLGAVSSGAIYGAWRKSLSSGIVAAIFIGALAALKHHAMVNNYELFPKPDPMYGGVYTPKRDFSLLKLKD